MDTLLIKMAAYLARESNSDEDQEEIILYALRLIYVAIGGTIAIIILASLAGVLIYALLAALTNAILRVKAGGAHATFTGSCFTLGAVIFTLIGVGVHLTPTLFLSQYVLLMTILSYFITRRVLLKYAPAETPEKPLGEERRKTLRIQTFKTHNRIFFFLLIFCIYIFLGLPYSNYITSSYLFAALVGILWETFTVTPSGYKVIGFLDKIMIKVFVLLRLTKSSNHINI